jgi:hypothetical protein
MKDRCIIFAHPFCKGANVTKMRSVQPRREAT